MMPLACVGAIVANPVTNRVSGFLLLHAVVMGLSRRECALAGVGCGQLVWRRAWAWYGTGCVPVAMSAQTERKADDERGAAARATVGCRVLFVLMSTSLWACRAHQPPEWAHMARPADCDGAGHWCRVLTRVDVGSLLAAVQPA